MNGSTTVINSTVIELTYVIINSCLVSNPTRAPYVVRNSVVINISVAVSMVDLLRRLFVFTGVRSEREYTPSRE